MIQRYAVAVACMFAAAPAATAQDSTGTRTTMDGVYTDEQATRGEQMFDLTCANCHATNFFTGSFMRPWTGMDVHLLYDLIRTTMPEDNPGGLPGQTYADVLAYIFQLNRMPPGDRELAPERETLEAITIRRRRR